MDTPGEDFQAVGVDTWERGVEIGSGNPAIAGGVVVTVDVDGNLWLSIQSELQLETAVVVLSLTPGEGAEIASAVWTASTYAARLRRAHSEPGTPPGADSGA